MMIMVAIMPNTKHPVDVMLNLNDFREFSIALFRSPLSMLLEVSNEYRHAVMLHIRLKIIEN